VKKVAAAARTGQQIKLTSNMYPIAMKKQIQANQYQVTVWGVNNRADGTEGKKWLNGRVDKE
jgi:hypothetical protein